MTARTQVLQGEGSEFRTGRGVTWPCSAAARGEARDAGDTAARDGDGAVQAEDMNGQQSHRQEGQAPHHVGDDGAVYDL